ncbi:hypothetical protein [Haloarcula sp. CBA1127]|uniref:hypothetical protein n=1 Tax=Haloarcula sp. CBA1127 TaxID=1765055 RepID=UPI00073EA116|nr:hypothetical protein [Haloarcula sp. CBA1127]
MTPDCNDRTIPRRQVLRAGGATLASILAGCNGLPPLGTQFKYGSIDVPQAEPPSYREWFPAPSALPDASDASDGYSAIVHVPPPTNAPTWARSSAARRAVVSNMDYVGVDVDDMDITFLQLYGTGMTATLVGDIDPAAVRDTVRETAYERVDTHAGYDLYERGDCPWTVAVGPEAVVFGNGPHARAVVTATVDAGRGDVTRYHERDANVAALTESAGQRRWGRLWLRGIQSITGGGMLEDTVGWAGWLEHDGKDVYTVETWLFPEEYDVSEQAVKEALKNDYPTMSLPSRRHASAVDVTVEGRVATITLAIKRSYVNETLAQKTSQLPAVAWRATHDPDAEQVTIHHDAGDSVPTDALRVTGDLDPSTIDIGHLGGQMEPGESFTVSTAAPETDDDAGIEVRITIHSDSGWSTTVYKHEFE